MAKNKIIKPETPFEIDDVVYHKADDDPNRGLVVAITQWKDHQTIQVDWGGGNISECYPQTLTEKYTPKFDQ